MSDKCISVYIYVGTYSFIPGKINYKLACRTIRFNVNTFNSNQRLYLIIYIVLGKHMNTILGNNNNSIIIILCKI